LEAHADGPLVERPGLTGREVRSVVVLAEPGRAVAVIPQDRADGRRVLADDTVVAGVAGGHFRDDAVAHGGMVAAGDQGCPRRRAERGGVEVGVAQPHLADALQVRRRDHAAEAAWGAEADIVGHDQQYVGCPLRRHHTRSPPGLRLNSIEVDLPDELGLRVGEIPAVDSCRGVGRTGATARLLALAAFLFSLEQRPNLAGRCGVAEDRPDDDGDKSSKSPILHLVAPLARTAPLPSGGTGHWSPSARSRSGTSLGP